MRLRIYTGEESGEPSFPEQQPEDRESHLLGQYIPLHYHYNMLQDEDRVGAFRQAIQLCVEPGMRVLELGGGTGILSFLAARQGAEVTCVEKNPALVRNAKRFLEQNGVGDLVEVVADDACNFIPPQPVDVVICEMLHVAMLREKQLQVIEAFKDHYQQAFSMSLPRFIPDASLLMVQPVEQSFDFSGFWAPVPLFHAPTTDNPRTEALGSFATYATILYDECFPTQFHWSGQLPIEQSGRLTALRFVTQNALAIDVPAERAINWPNQCLVLPVEAPFDVTQGQAVEVEFQYAAGGSIESLCQSLRVQAVESKSSDSQQQLPISRPYSDFVRAA